MKNYWKDFFENFKTNSNSTFIKKQILNVSLFHLISLVALVCAIVLLVLGSLRELIIFDVFGAIFLICFFLLMTLSWVLIILLNQNTFFVKRIIGSKFNYLFFAFWLGFSFTDAITKYELENNYDFGHNDNKFLAPTKKSDSVSSIKNAKSETDITDSIVTTEILEAAAETKLIEQKPKLDAQVNDQVEMATNSYQDQESKLHAKLVEYQELLKHKEELEAKLANLKNSFATDSQNEEELEKTIVIEDVKTQIMQQTSIIVEAEKEVDSLLSEIDFSSRTKMIRKKGELENLLAYYQNKKNKLSSKN
ncbi:hypothetical protein MCAV_00380 [[Mycoplasma] cavipharyngis]|uniref:hypothetical protein n=1 Tax=[Mycoplasma] cavipharyngis TaxID=92757 RepID=UPI003704442E